MCGVCTCVVCVHVWCVCMCGMCACVVCVQVWCVCMCGTCVHVWYVHVCTLCTHALTCCCCVHVCIQVFPIDSDNTTASGPNILHVSPLNVSPSPWPHPPPPSVMFIFSIISHLYNLCYWVHQYCICDISTIVNKSLHIYYCVDVTYTIFTDTFASHLINSKYIIPYIFPY